MKRLLRVVLAMIMISAPMAFAAEKQPPANAPTECTGDAAPPLTREPARAVPVQPRPKPRKSVFGASSEQEVVVQPGPIPAGPPVELRLTRAGSSRFDLRNLPQTPPVKVERPEREEPPVTPVTLPGTPSLTREPDAIGGPLKPVVNAPAPSPSASFDGLDFANWGAGHPPDTNGDVGPTYYIQTINTSIGVFRKSDGVRVAAFTFNTFMSQGHFGNLCDTNNFGDPVVLYDSFEDRWIITDFAFQLDGGGNVINPPGSFQCFAASMSGDPVSGGWNFYSINTAGGLGDYPKFGIWPDGLYMSANMFQYASGGSFINPRVYALNKAQMYAGRPTVQVVSFDAPSAEFTLLPANARVQTGTPPPGSPNYYSVVWQFLNVVSVYKFHVDWTSISLSTFTGPFLSVTATNWSQFTGASARVPSPANNLDTLYPRLMVQNEYSNIGGVESLWDSHTVGASGASSAQAAVRYYQVKVTGGTVEANASQAFTWSPDATVHRFMPSTAVDRVGNMAIGYSGSSATLFPAIRYAGRLSTDPVNTISQTETSLLEGTGSQSGSCGGTCSRWGDYSAMTLDPNGCSLWYTNMYYATSGLAFLTRIGSFAFPACTPVGAGGTLQGTVTALVGGAPLVGATVAFGSRVTTTSGSGFYSFSGIPAGTYPTLTVGQPGYVSQTVTGVSITDGGTTTDDFALAAAAANGCFTDTTQADFQTGVPTTVDLLTSPGDIILLNAANIDQQNTSTTGSGFGFNSTSWAGQTFTPSVTGQLTRADVDLFCSGCTGTTPNITVSIRATTGATPVPTGADLATATITGFNSGAGGFFTANFASPATLTAGTRYAVIFRAVSNPSAGTYAYVCSCAQGTIPNSSPYANGQRVTSANSGATWAADVTAGGRDLGFKIYMKTGFAPSGNQVSGLKDSNPTAGLTPIWSTLSWTATTPANTAIQFQVAGSNSDSGPFNFVGPDGTNATFFTTSGASLSQFYGLRYLEYKAYLASTNNAATPTLNDVTMCFADTDCSVPPVITPTPAQVCANSTGNTASGPAGETTYAWTISNGSITGGASSQTVTYTAGAAGSVGLTLNVVEPAGCHKSNLINVPILGAPTITPGGPTTFCAGGSVTLTSSSATGNQWYLNTNPIGGATNQSYVATASGNYTVTGDGCAGPASAITTVTVNPLPATPTITPGGPTTFTYPGNVTLTSSSATGNQWDLNTSPIGGATNQAYIASTSGNYTVTVTDGNGCVSAPSAITTVVVNPATPVVTATGGTFTYDGTPHAGSGTATGGAGESLTVTLSYSGTGSTVYGPSSTAPSLVGTYSVVAHTPGDANNTAGDSAPAALTINKANPAVTATGGTFTYDGNPHAGSGSATGGAGESLSVTVSYAGTGSTTYGPTATAPSLAGTYTITAHTPGDANNNAGDSSAVALTINKFNPLMAAFGGTFTYNASPRAGSGQALGGAGESLPVTLSYFGISGTTYGPSATPPTNVGVYLITAHTVGDANNNAEDSLPNALRINKATATIVVNHYCVPFDGAAHTATGTATGVVSEALTGLVLTATTHTAAGTYLGDAWSFSNANYSSASGTVDDSIVNAVITAPPSTITGSTGNAASVINAGVGATYAWGITNGSITGGTGTNSITFTAGAVGPLTLNITVTTTAGCSEVKSANVTVLPFVAVTNVSPAGGLIAGGTPVTITGTGFASGATVTIGGVAATNIVVVSAIKITAKTAAHAAGAVNVTVTNTDTSTGTEVNGYTYLTQQFDANGDGMIDPSDIFYLVNYLFSHGPAPRGLAGMASGDANGDGVVDPADIFYVINFLFTHGPAPMSAPVHAATTAAQASQRLSGSVTLGTPFARNGRQVIPVIVTADSGSATPQALALRVRFESDVAVSEAAIRRAGAAKDAVTSFETSQVSGDELSYLVSFDEKAGGLVLGSGEARSAIVAEIEFASDSPFVAISIDPAVTMLSDAGGTSFATVARGTLQVYGTTVGTPRPAPGRPQTND